MKAKQARLLGIVAACAIGAAMTGAAHAQDEESDGGGGGWFDGIDISFGGFIRPEIAVSTSSYDNPANQLGNIFNGRTIERAAYVPPTFVQSALNVPVLGPIVGALPPVTSWTTLPVGALATDSTSPGLRGRDNDGTGQPFETVDNDINYEVLRAEAELGVQLTQDFKFIARLRALYDPADYDEFDARDYDQTRGGITGGYRKLYAGTPSYFDYEVEGGGTGNPLEWAGENYQVYFPALFLEYNSGPLNLRLGNQQIAWGQAIFFRVFDVVNGLDLRRHSLLDYAQEEFSDKRVPSLALRAGYQITDSMLVDGFVQKFQPTIYGNPNTQYNVIPVQFTVHDNYKTGGYDEKLSYGIRFKGDFGQWGMQAMAVERYNPDGVFRWTESGVNKDLPNTPGTLGWVVNTTLAASGRTSGEILARTPFEASPGGVYSADEWFNYAAQVRLLGISGLNASIDEFPGSQEIFASHVETYEEAANELNTFFIAAGGSLRGHIEREYFKEQVYGLGASYVVEGEPGGLLDQLIINVETSFTPDRTFTGTSLQQAFMKDDAFVGALVMEKYHRFTQAFPATYLVFQYMYRDTDDMFGRHLSGYGGVEQRTDGNGNTVNPEGQGVDGAHYIAFAFQQPFPQDIYRIGFAALYDPRGSLLVQPGIKWKPSGAWTLEAFYTYINGALGDANPNETLLSTVDFADELTVRIAYQF